MNRLILLFLICQFFWSQLPAQTQQELDSLLELVADNIPADTNKVNILNQIAYDFAYRSPDTTRIYALQALQLAEKLNYKAGIARAYNQFGNSYWVQGQLADAIDYYKKTLEIAEQIDDPRNIMRAFGNLGIVYADLQEFDIALDWYQKAKELAYKLNDRRAEAIIASNIGEVLFARKEYDQSEQYFLEGIGLSDQIFFNKYRLAWLYTEQARLEEADSLLIISERALANTKEVREKGELKRIRALWYLNKQDYQKAHSLALQAVEEYIKIDYKRGLYFTYDILALAAEAQGEYKKALYYTKQHDHYFNLVNTLIATSKSKIFHKEREAISEDLKRRQLEFESEKVSFNMRFMLSITLLSVLFVIILFALFIQKREVNKTLKQQIETNQEQQLAIAQQTKALKESNQTKDRLFSIIGHDLRGPLASIRSLIEILELTNSPTEAHEIMEHLKSSVNSLQDTLSNLLAWSIAQKDVSSNNAEPVNLHELTLQKVQLYENMARQKHIEIELRIPAHYYVLADRNQLEVILRNLLSNAIKFTRHGGSVIIDARKNDTFVELLVQDNGIGIPPDKCASLFGNTNLEQSTQGTSGEQGTGLGLQLCKEMAKANGGDIRVESTLGKGTTFYVSLPQSNPDLPTAR